MSEAMAYAAAAPSFWQGRKAALIMGANSIGSRERVLFRLADRLIDLGASVDILSPAPRASWRSAMPTRANLVDTASLLAKPLPNLVRIMLSPPILRRYLRRTRPDIAMTLSIPTALAALRAARRADVSTKLVIRQSNVVHIKNSLRYGDVDRRWRDPLIKKLYPDADAIIAVSEGVADNLRHLGVVGASNIHAIANGVLLDEIDRLAAAPLAHPWFQEQPAPLPVITAVGRLVPKKDYQTLLRAIALVRQRRDVRLMVLGEGQERQRLQSLSGKLVLDDAVDFFGRVENPFAFLARSSLYVLSSTYEGMPSALIEALACGCPAVSTDCPSGPSQILDDGRYGRLVAMGDVDGLAAAILETLEAPPPRERQRRRAEDFTVDRTLEGYVGVLEGVLREP